MFQAPPGATEQRTAELRRPRRLTIPEAQERAPFIVLVPARVPPSWQMTCTLVESSGRRGAPTEVKLRYRSGDGHEDLSISEIALDERSQHHYDTVAADGKWEDRPYDNGVLRVRPPDWGQAQTYLERDGTFALLVSNALTNAQVAAIAAGLKPAPSATRS